MTRVDPFVIFALAFAAGAIIAARVAYSCGARRGFRDGVCAALDTLTPSQDRKG